MHITIRLDGFNPEVFGQVLAAAQAQYQEWRAQMQAEQLRLALSVPDWAARQSLEREILRGTTLTEVRAVRKALRAGRLWHTMDACVIAVIAAMRGQDYASIRMRAPLFERWLYQLPPGATPATDVVAALLDAWLAAWLDAHAAEPAPDPDLVLELPPRRVRVVVDADLVLRE